MKRTYLVAAAVVLDLCAGDPPALPHPVSAIAAIARDAERHMRRHVANELVGGGLAALGVVALCAGVGACLDHAPSALRVAAAASTLALGSLLDHAGAVADALDAHDLAAARLAVGRMVGRDTAHLDESAIACAAIESIAESTCDGVVAPLLFLAIGGVAGAYAYKAINTLDSLIGHIEPPYTRFGRVAARLDDVANAIPARLGAGALALGALLCGEDARAACHVALRDARLHRSPNAGWSEAAMAGALRVELSAPRSYDGIPAPSPRIGAGWRPPRAGDLRRAMRVTFCAGSIAAALCVGIAAMRR